MCSKIMTAIIILLVGCGCWETGNQNSDYKPCSRARVEAFADFPLGNWKIDKNSLEFLRIGLKWSTLINERDHRLAIHNDGFAFGRFCLCAYGEFGDIDYENQLNSAGLSVESTPKEQIDATVLSTNDCAVRCVYVQPSAYKMRWKVVSREEWLHHKNDKYGDIFDRYYFNVDYQNQFEVAVVFYEEQGNEHFFAVGEDDKGVYLTPRVFRSRFNHDLMELAVKFRKEGE